MRKRIRERLDKMKDRKLKQNHTINFMWINKEPIPSTQTYILMGKYEGKEAILIQTADNIDGKFIIDSTDNKKGTFTFGDDDKFNSYSELQEYIKNRNLTLQLNIYKKDQLKDYNNEKKKGYLNLLILI